MKRIIRPGPWSETLAALFIGFVWGGLLGCSLVHDRLYLPEHKMRVEADETNELLMDHSDAQACVVMVTALSVRQSPGYEHVVEYGEWAVEQLSGGSWPEALEFCRGGE